MRAEIALQIIADVAQENEELTILQRIKDLSSLLEEQVASPNEDNQVRVAALRDDLIIGLGKSRFNDYPPSLDPLLDSLDLRRVVGNQLARKIRRAFSGNDVTPASALKKLKLIGTSIDDFYGHVASYLASSEYFEIRSDDLEPDDYEFSITVPRDAVNNELDDFGRELVKLDKLFSLFEEIVTASRSDFKIKSISSSDLTVVLESTPAVALAIVAAIERVVAVYEKILSVVKIHREMKAAKVPDTLSKDMQKHIEHAVKAELETVGKEILKTFSPDIQQARKNELRNELKVALNEIAGRIDRGYIFDVRAGEPADVEEGHEETIEDVDVRKRYHELVARRENIKLFKAQEGPVLQIASDTEGENPHEPAD